MTTTTIPPAKEDASSDQTDFTPGQSLQFHQIAWSVALLAVIASLATIYFARAILFPIALAGLLNLVFKPIVSHASRWRAPPALSAFVVLLVVTFVVSGGIALLWEPATGWISDFPNIRAQLTEKLRPLRHPVQKLNEASEEVENMANSDAPSAMKVRVEQPGITTYLFNTSLPLLATILLTITLLYFLLAEGDNFLEKVVSLMPTFQGKKNVVQLSRDIQQSISSYLFTITCINLCLGLAIGLAMWALGLPTPVLWGVMAALLNFIPFAGATVGAMVVFLVALLQFDLSYACLAPAIYVFVNVIESYWVTPALLGKSMSLNPVVILLSITLWGWMWGIGGVFMAVPLLVVLKIICDNVETLTPLGRMMES